MNEELRFTAPRKKQQNTDFQHPDLLGSKIDWVATTPESYEGQGVNMLYDEYGQWPGFNKEQKDNKEKASS